MKSLPVFIASVILGLTLGISPVQGQPFQWGSFQNVPLRINATSNYVVNAADNAGWIQLQPSGGFAVVANFASTNASTSNTVITLQLSADKLHPVSRTLIANPVLTGTTASRYYTNFTLLDITGHANNMVSTDKSGLNYFRLYSISNAHGASLWTTNILWLLPRE